LNLINEMGTRIMFRRFFLMATMAGDRLGMDFCTFLVDMLFHIDDVPVATVTGVCSMNRLGELSLVDLVSVTPQTFGIIDTLITVFTALDDELIAPFLRLRRVYAFSGFRTLFAGGGAGCPEQSAIQKESESEDDERKKKCFDLRFHKSPDVKKIPPLLLSINRESGEVLSTLDETI
jgi:hypothetical protein